MSPWNTSHHRHEQPAKNFYPCTPATRHHSPPLTTTHHHSPPPSPHLLRIQWKRNKHLYQFVIICSHVWRFYLLSFLKQLSDCQIITFHEETVGRHLIENWFLNRPVLFKIILPSFHIVTPLLVGVVLFFPSSYVSHLQQLGRFPCYPLAITHSLTPFLALSYWLFDCVIVCEPPLWGHKSAPLKSQACRPHVWNPEHPRTSGSGSHEETTTLHVQYCIFLKKKLSGK